MKILKSPYDMGPKIVRRSLPIVGALFGPLLWSNYRDSIIKQTQTRGVVPLDVWGSKERLKVAKVIEKIINEVCWGEEFTFHPDDPYHVVGELEVGDLSEVEALICIEQEFNIKIDDTEISAFFDSKPTFGQFVDWVMNKCC